MFGKKTIILSLSLALTACVSGKESHKVSALQKKDKNLSCKEILLEMNEADFYRNMAHKNRGPKLKNVLMPLGYISTYMNAEEAIGAAEARVSYLDKIYEIMKCEEKEEQMENVPLYRPYSGAATPPALPKNGEVGFYYPR